MISDLNLLILHHLLILLVLFKQYIPLFDSLFCVYYSFDQ